MHTPSLAKVAAAGVTLLLAFAAVAAPTTQTSLSADPTLAPMRSVIEHYTVDQGALERRYPVRASTRRATRLHEFYDAERAELERMDFDALDEGGRIDYLLLAAQLKHLPAELEHTRRHLDEVRPLLPFCDAIVSLDEARQRGERPDPEAAARALTDVQARVADVRRSLEAKKKAGEKDVPSPVLALRAAEWADRLANDLRDWDRFYADYDPLFTWWTREPYPKADKALRDYAEFLKQSFAGYAAGQAEEPVIGDPIGREALLDALATEFIPYSPEELIEIANHEFAWCDREMKRAARDLGCGDDWRAALAKVTAMHVPPGEQPQLIRQLAEEATAFVEERNLVTVPPLCKESWRMEMMSPQRQRVNPYFTGGETISVSYPTEEMSFDDKVMSLRGNNVPSCRATVFHELIPGHHLQGFMAERYNAHRQAFYTPFLVEGWALYWEMRMWDLGFPRTAEERVGMLFWRAHRCARIIFSLKFHLGQMTAQEAIDFLVDRVGHERRNATAEVRRSVNGSYGPLYQAAYMLGALQLRALRAELVESRGMTDRQFNDAVLRENAIPVELIRASLTGQKLTRDFKTNWRFYGELAEAKQPAPAPAPAAPPPSNEGPRVYRDHVEPHWFEGGTKFWYRNDLASGRKEFIVVDAKRGTREVVKAPPAAADASVESLPAGSRVRPSRRTGDATTLMFENHTAEVAIVDWVDAEGQRKRYASIAPGDSWEAQTYDGHVWVAAAPSGKILGVYEATAGPATAILGAAPSSQSSPRDRPQRARAGGTSPDGKWVATVHDANLYLRPTAGGDEVKLSDDGKPGDAYAEREVWWSPDSSHLVAMRTEPAQEHKIYEVESSPKDQVQPKLRTIDYLKPGDRIAHPRPQLFSVADRKHVPIDETLSPTPWSVEDVRWSADSSRFTFVYNQRGHQVLRVIAVDAATGAAKVIVDERSKTFIDYSGKFFCRWVGDDELLWTSERDGWNHLWLYDAKTGQVKNQVTRGEWVVQAVTWVDEAKRQVWFQAGGVRPGQDPYYTHFCRVNLDGSGFVVLTAGDGTHKWQWSPGDAYFIDTWSRVDQPPVTELRRCDTGEGVSKLEEADAKEALASRGGRWPERFVAKGRDGTTDIYGVIVYPRDFDPAKKYPVVENIYAGPQGFFTPKAFKARWGHQQAIADLGMIVVQCDGMGTSGRSKAFHDVCWKDLKDAGFADRIAWIEAAAATRPFMDLSRVGIYGGSAGGQNALAALIWHHDFYKVAVADCGCHDNRMDKIWWNEQWMGWPVDDSYAASSNVVNAALVEGKLMLVVGELDSNVDPASTMQVVNAMEKANKDFELVVVTGANHGAAETPYGSKRRAGFLAKNLLHLSD